MMTMRLAEVTPCGMEGMEIPLVVISATAGDLHASCWAELQ
jgi:hypothetical protein